MARSDVPWPNQLHAQRSHLGLPPPPKHTPSLPSHMRARLHALAPTTVLEGTPSSRLKRSDPCTHARVRVRSHTLRRKTFYTHARTPCVSACHRRCATHDGGSCAPRVRVHQAGQARGLPACADPGARSRAGTGRRQRPCHQPHGGRRAGSRGGRAEQQPICLQVIGVEPAAATHMEGKSDMSLGNLARALAGLARFAPGRSVVWMHPLDCPHISPAHTCARMHCGAARRTGL